MRGMAPTKHAFTLIELLIVIVIMGVLMSLLLPTLSKAKLTSKRTRSIANQKQISIAYNSYLHDNRGRYPQVWGFAAAGGKLGNLTNSFKVPPNAPPGFDINQVALFYGSTTLPDDRPLNGDFAAGPESLEVELFEETQIPWDELAFPTIERTLRHFFDDRRQGTFELHLSQIGKEERERYLGSA